MLRFQSKSCLHFILIYRNGLRFKLHFPKKYIYIYIKKFSTVFTVIMIYQESLIKEIYINLMLSISVFLNLLIYFRIQVKQGSKLIRLYYTYTLIWESIARQKIREIFKDSWITKKEQFCYTVKAPNSRHPK